MGALLGSLFGLREDERPMAFLMAAYHILLLITLYLLKPVRDSLFLSTRGPAELPYVFILTTIVVVPVALLHTRAGTALSLGPLIDGGSLFLALSLLGLRGLLSLEGTWVTYVLYAWVSIYGLLITSQFWLLANALFSSSQSKRVFTVLSAGAIVGAIIGGEVTSLLVQVVGLASRNLIWIASGVLLLATALAHWIRRLHHQRTPEAVRATAEQTRSDEQALSILRDSRHLQLIVGIITIMVVVSTLVDYQFKTVAARAYPTEAGLTSFMGQFYGGVSVVALLVQFVVAPRLMRILGIGGALSVLPGMLALGSFGMLILPGLAAGIFLRGAGQSLKHSIDKTGRELLFVPVPLPEKKRVKVFVDVFVDQGAQGLGGLLLLLLATLLGVGVQALSLITIALIAGWGVLAYRARQSYVDQFRAQLRRQETMDEETSSAEEGEETDLDELLESLCSHAETEALRALEQLENGSDPVPVDALKCLLDHPSAAVRATALRVLRVRAIEGVGEEVAEALRDPDPDVQLEAARYLYCQETEKRDERLRQSLDHEDPHVQAAAVGLIAEEGGPEEFALIDESLLRRLVQLGGEEGTQIRTHVARILGVLDRPFRNELLRELLRDESPHVVRAAITAAAQTGDRSFVFPLVYRIGEDAFETTVRQALGAFDPPILGTLYDILVDEQVDLETRRRIPSVFVEQPGAFAVMILIRGLQRVSLPLRHAIARALSKLHQSVEVHPNDDLLDEAIRRDAEHYAALGQILRVCRRTADTALPIEPSVLQSYRQETLERIFRLLGLRYDQRDIYDAYLGLTSNDPALRDSAIEFVDNLVDYETRRYLLPLLDDPNGTQAFDIGEQFFDRTLRTPVEARQYLLKSDDPRLADLLTPEVEADAPPPSPSTDRSSVSAPSLPSE